MCVAGLAGGERLVTEGVSMSGLPEWQQRLEGQLLELLDRPLRAEQSMTEAFGPLERWQIEVCGVELWLNPVERRWWYLDAVHETWEPVRHRVGEVRFVEVDGELDVAPLSESEDPERWTRFQAWDAKMAAVRSEALATGLGDGVSAGGDRQTVGADPSRLPPPPGRPAPPGSAPAPQPSGPAPPPPPPSPRPQASSDRRPPPPSPRPPDSSDRRPPSPPRPPVPPSAPSSLGGS